MVADGATSCCNVSGWAEESPVSRSSSGRSFMSSAADAFAGGAQVGELHLGILAREEHAIGAGAEGGADGGAHVVGRGSLFVLAGGNVDVDAGPDLDRAADAGERTLGLARDVIGGEACLRQIGELGFVAVVLHAVGEGENGVGRE